MKWHLESKASAKVVDQNRVAKWVGMRFFQTYRACDVYRTDIDRRVGLAAEIVRNLHNVWKATDISKSVKTKLHQTFVQSIPCAWVQIS